MTYVCSRIAYFFVVAEQGSRVVCLKGRSSDAGSCVDIKGCKEVVCKRLELLQHIHSLAAQSSKELIS